ncbi:MAG TPA: zinc-ribbon domain-containing protein [Nitrososphaeraceae archaeon]|nr:zinc-ribbon domain-containing protein [Nitrososphaeraceae archaeon]
MTNRPKFCSNCGESLDQESKKCSKCGIDFQQQQIEHPISNTSIVDQLPYKSPGTAALIAFIGGIFALLGLGHIFIGKIGKGVGILVSGIIIYVLFVIMAISLPVMLLLGLVESFTGYAGSGGIIFIIMFILGIAYLVLWIWQIFNAKKLAKKFNELVRTNGGKEPW